MAVLSFRCSEGTFPSCGELGLLSSYSEWASHWADSLVMECELMGNSENYLFLALLGFTCGTGFSL